MVFSIVLGFILGLGIPTLLPLIPNVTLDLGTQIIIGLLSSIIPILIEIQKSVEYLKEKRKKEIEIENVKNEFDIELQKISKNYSQLNDIQNHGIFSTYFLEEIKSIGNAVLDAAQKQNFMGRVQNFVDEKYILDCFGNSKTKIWKFTWLIESSGSPIGEGVDPGWIAYWNHALNLLTKKKISGMEILFLADDSIIEEILGNNSKLKSYLSSMSCGKYIKAKIISTKSYIHKFNSAFKYSRDTDFGIYGDNMLFVYKSDNEDYGWYIKNSDQIKTYTSFFDTVFSESTDIK